MQIKFRVCDINYKAIQTQIVTYISQYIVNCIKTIKYFFIFYTLKRRPQVEMTMHIYLNISEL